MSATIPEVNMQIREATEADWAAIWPFWHEIVSAGTTYSWSPGTDEAKARRAWMLSSPAVVYVVEDDEQAVVATAQLHPVHPGRSRRHIANASFMVAPAASGYGIGRKLGEYVLEQARLQGYRAMQFNAVVETNAAAITLWRSLGFSIIGTVPDAFRHPDHGYVGLHIMHRTL